MPALSGIEVAFYLIHSMMSGTDFHQRDQTAAGSFAQAAKSAGVQKIVYLGGLGDPDADLSDHLRSRQQTGAALRSAGVPVLEFRAGVIVGSGSASFEMIRYFNRTCPDHDLPALGRTLAPSRSASGTFSTTYPQRSGYRSPTIKSWRSEDPRFSRMRICCVAMPRIRGLKRVIIPVPSLDPASFLLLGPLGNTHTRRSRPPID